MPVQPLEYWAWASWHVSLVGMIVGGGFVFLLLLVCLLVFVPLTQPLKNILLCVLIVWVFLILMNSFGVWGTPWHHGVHAW